MKSHIPFSRSDNHQAVLKSRSGTALLLASLSLVSACASVASDIQPPVPAADRALEEFVSKYREPQMIKIADGVHLAFNYDFANVMYVEGKTGIIVVDTGMSVERARVSLAAFRAQVSRKPVKAIIYSHGHADHVSGARAFLDEASPGVQIWASANWERYQRETSSALKPFVAWRAGAQLGSLLPPGTAGTIGQAGGQMFREGRTQSYIPPNHTFQGEQDVTIDGVSLRLMSAASELDDEITVWFPRQKVMYGADIATGGLPIVSTPRNEVGRSAVGFADSCERMLEFPIEHLVNGHNEPVDGHATVMEFLQNNRDAAAFINDQVIRSINHGLSQDDTVAAVQLPPHLATLPYLNGHYHPLDVLVRGLYVHYSGFLGPDALELVRITDTERAGRLAELAGGKDRLLEVARAAYDRGDFAWAGELATHVMRLDPADAEAKQLRIYSLKAIAFASASSNVRHYLLTDAALLDGGLPPNIRSQLGKNDPANVTFLSVGDLLRNLGPRLDPVKSASVAQSMEVRVVDRHETYELQIRRGVLQVRPGAAPDASIRLEAIDAVLRQLLTSRAGWREAVANGTVKVSRGETGLDGFLGLFD